MFLIIAVAAWLRLAWLDFRGFWIDEADWLGAIDVPSIAQAAQAGNFPHTPFFAIVMWPFRSLFDDDWSARMIPALLGIATVPMLYAIGARLFTPGAGMIAAAVLALCPIHVDYSRQFEPYAMAAFMITAAVLLMLRARDRPTPRRWLVAALASAASIYGSIFASVVLGLISGVLFLGAAGSGQIKRAITTWAGFWCAVLAVYLPFFAYSFLFKERVHGLGKGDQFSAYFPTDYNFIDRAQLVCAGIWRDDRIELTAPLLACAILLWTISLLWARRKPLALGVALAWGGAAALIVLVAYTQHYQPTGRYFITTIPGFCLLAGASLHALLAPPVHRRYLRFASRVFALLLLAPLAYWNLGALAAYYVAPPTEDNKHLLKAVEAAARPTDKIFCAIADPPLMIERYAPSLASIAETIPLSTFPETIADHAIGQTRVWYVYRTPKAGNIIAAIKQRGLASVEFPVRGRNTFAILIWPKGTSGNQIQSDTIEALTAAVHPAGANGGELRTLLANVTQAPSKDLLESALVPFTRQCIANPTDAAAHAALGKTYAALERYSDAARAYSRAILVANGENEMAGLADGLLSALAKTEERSPLIVRMALNSLSPISVIVNGSLEQKDETGRPRGWIVSPPDALIESRDGSAFDGKEYVALRSSSESWSILGVNINAGRALLDNGALTVSAYGKAPADTMFLSVDARIQGTFTTFARKAWPESAGDWTMLGLEVPDIPAFDPGTLQLRISIRNVAGRTALIDNAKATLRLAPR
ncbi:MAG: glycosyltransferase family 39 protein [Candidatus Hydrogenedentes bacterium]|nr:glycosyltransferase family 39 protein [Candidatus Hydrogenedentota bacterium]